MRLLAVVMSGAVVAGAAVWAQTQRTTPEPKTALAPAPRPTAVDKGARWLASVQGVPVEKSISPRCWPSC